MAVAALLALALCVVPDPVHGEGALDAHEVHTMDASAGLGEAASAVRPKVQNCEDASSRELPAAGRRCVGL